MQLLIAGGAGDPNIQSLISAATAAGVMFGVAWAAADDIGVHVGTEGVLINGRQHLPQSLFARFNVFGYDPHADTANWWRYHNWHTALCGALPKARTINPHSAASSKFSNLCLAARCGLAIPRTAIASSAPFDGICKPLHGGDHTKMIRRGEAVPWGLGFCQAYLPGPEYRIYLVGDRSWVFSVQSASLDYRVKQDAVIAPVGGMEGEVQKSRQVAGALGLRFAAVDFRCGERGPFFLEINDGPMFAAFDKVVGGEISAEIVSVLCSPEASDATEV